MGAASEKQRADDNQALLNYGFRFFETHKLYAGGQPLAEPVLWRGAAEKIPLGTTDDVLVTLPRGRYAELQASLDIPAHLVAPYTKGQSLGTLKVTLGDKTLSERPLVALADAPEGGFFKRLYDDVWLWFEGDAGARTNEAAPAASAAD
jgi:D-alanyl-D-alanine carboxypeptidase (penicillin-binding protein 5/6)